MPILWYIADAENQTVGYRKLERKRNMSREKNLFVTFHYVDEEYHRSHPQMVHRHNDVLELLYIMEGGGNYLVGKHEYVVQPGNLVICNAGVFHGEPLAAQAKQMVSYCCVLDGVRLPGLPQNTLTGNEDSPVLFFHEERQEIESLYYVLYDLFRRDKEYKSVCEHVAHSILELVLFRLRKRNRVNEETNRKNNVLVRAVSEYLDEHFMETLTLEDLETEFHISRFALSRVFKAETGFAPMKYVMMRRIGEAQSLLMNTTISIGDVGEQLGFTDNSHFSNTFKKYIGITPGAYRKHFREEQ